MKYLAAVASLGSPLPEMNKEKNIYIFLDYGFRVIIGRSKIQQHQLQSVDKANWQMHYAKAEPCSPKGWEKYMTESL